jgi:hypothetical protein
MAGDGWIKLIGGDRVLAAAGVEKHEGMAPEWAAMIVEAMRGLDLCQVALEAARDDSEIRHAIIAALSPWWSMDWKAGDIRTRSKRDALVEGLEVVGDLLSWQESERAINDVAEIRSTSREIGALWPHRKDR